MNKMKDIDKRIIETMNNDEAELFSSMDEENLFSSWMGIYSGENKYIAIVLSVFTTIFAIAAFYFGYHFFTTEAQPEMIRYGAAMFIFIIFTAFIKLWFWNQMDKRAILREIKRAEFQLSLLMKKSSDQAGFAKYDKKN
jgi:hypothetical protein